MKLNVDVYLHLPSSALFPIYKKINNWNSGKVYVVICGGLLVACGRLLVFCGRLWSLPVLVITVTNGIPKKSLGMALGS